MRKLAVFVLLLVAFVSKAQVFNFDFEEYLSVGTFNQKVTINMTDMSFKMFDSYSKESYDLKIFESKIGSAKGDSDEIGIILKLGKYGNLPNIQDILFVKGDSLFMSSEEDKSNCSWIFFSKVGAILKTQKLFEDASYATLLQKKEYNGYLVKYQKLIDAVRKRQGQNSQVKQQPAKPAQPAKPSKPATPPDPNLKAMLDKPMKSFNLDMGDLYASVERQNNGEKFKLKPEIEYENGVRFCYKNCFGKGFEIGGYLPKRMFLTLKYEEISWWYVFEPGDRSACAKFADLLRDKFEALGYRTEHGSHCDADYDFYGVEKNGIRYTIMFSHNNYNTCVSIICRKEIPQQYRAEHRFILSPAELFTRPFAATAEYAGSYSGLLKWFDKNLYNRAYCDAEKIMAYSGVLNEKNCLDISVDMPGISKYDCYQVGREEYRNTGSGYRFEIQLEPSVRKGDGYGYITLSHKENQKECKNIFNALLAGLKPAVYSLRKDKNKKEMPNHCAEMWSAVKGDRIYYFCLLKSGDVILKEIKN